MAETVAALLELWAIDQRRRELSKARNAHTGTMGKAEADWKTAEAAEKTAKDESERIDALTRQYAADVERCDKVIAELSQKKLSAKSNREYMDIHNGIEQARSEKTQREMSVKEVGARKEALAEKVKLAAEKASAAKTRYEATKNENSGATVVTSDEAELDRQAEAIRPRVDPEFLATYEKLVKIGHKQPLLRIDPKTRSTPFGTLLSHNQVEQIRQGKLVIDRATNAIMYIA